MACSGTWAGWSKNRALSALVSALSVTPRVRESGVEPGRAHRLSGDHGVKAFGVRRINPNVFVEREASDAALIQLLSPGKLTPRRIGGDGRGTGREPHDSVGVDPDLCDDPRHDRESSTPRAICARVYPPIRSERIHAVAGCEAILPECTSPNERAL